MTVTDREDFFGTGAGRRKLQDAIAVVYAAAQQSAEDDDARRFALGGVVADDERLIEAYLQNLNDNLGGELIPALVYTGKRSAGTALHPDTVTAHLNWLNEVIADPGAVAVRDGDQLRKQLAGRVVKVLRLRIQSDGVEFAYRPLLPDDAATETYIQLKLLTPAYHSRLRRCELKACLKVFLADLGDPKKPRRYCSVECSKEGTRTKTLTRVQNFRKAKKTPRRHK